MFARLFLVFAVLSLTACGSPYVNIPPLQGDSPAAHDPDGASVAKVEAVALKHLIVRDNPADGYVVDLPAGTSKQTYAQVLDQLPVGAQTVGEGQSGLPHYEVAQVQVRGFSAQVDIIRPASALGKQELVSVYVAVDMDGWYAQKTRVWRVPVDQALALARAAPPVEEPAEEQAEQATE
ncbi:hypothetical protein HED60_09240 [Planctomycetales bacterium ZRK34]|nr:hypothetical protein HED60_09240 [Planctomycetales bacterium ZRK34]